MKNDLKNNKQAKVILNWLPPANTEYPSAGLSILKGFLQHHGYPVEIKYWNILFASILDNNNLRLSSANNKAFSENILLIPFYNYLARKKNDPICIQKIRWYLESRNPALKGSNQNYFSEFLDSISEEIIGFIKVELDTIDWNNTICFGCSSKFFQWIPAAVLVELVKAQRPGIKIVMGGFSGREEAMAIMDACPEIDFAIWGEGEYPLLSLCQQLTESTPLWDRIERMLYREGDKIKLSKKSSGLYLDLEEAIYPDFTDYLETAEKKGLENCYLTLEGSRGCHWRKCAFCFLNEGYKNRRKSPARLLSEMKYLHDTYNHDDFVFVDNDLVGKDEKTFELFLDGLLKYTASLNNAIKIYNAEVVSQNLNASIIKKMAHAGFMNIQIGYEAPSDRLLKKMNKSSSFADHLIMIKFSLKYRIMLNGLNILKGIVNETDEDILECLDNLQYLRFFLAKNRINHNLSVLFINKNCHFYKMIPADEKIKWCKPKWDHLNFLPKNWINPDCYFTVFAYENPQENPLWESFREMDQYYINSDYHYKLFKNQDIIFYEEYKGFELVNNIGFDQPIYWEILSHCNSQKGSLHSIQKNLTAKGFPVSETQIQIHLRELQSEYLIYCNTDDSEIVTIIDTDDVKE